MLQLFSFPHLWHFASFEKKFYNALNFLNTIFEIIAQHIFDFHETSTYLSAAERKIICKLRIPTTTYLLPHYYLVNDHYNQIKCKEKINNY